MSIQLDFRTLSLTLMLFGIVFGLGMFAYAMSFMILPPLCFPT